MEGWIKIHRKIADSAMYKALTSKQRDVMMQCLIMANFKHNEWEWGRDVFKCSPGQFITSLENLARNCASDVKVQSVRTALLKLEKWQFLTNISTKTGRLITILNWDTYQLLDDEPNKDSNKQLTKHQQRPNKDLTTNKESKEGKECKEEDKIPASKKINNIVKVEKDKHEFIDRIIEIFAEEYQQANRVEYVTDFSNGKDRAAAGKILNLHKRKNPGMTSEETLESLKLFFSRCVVIKNEWLRDHMSLSIIVSQFNSITNILKNENQRVNKGGVTEEQLAGIVARKFASDAPGK